MENAKVAGMGDKKQIVAPLLPIDSDHPPQLVAEGIETPSEIIGQGEAFSRLVFYTRQGDFWRRLPPKAKVSGNLWVAAEVGHGAREFSFLLGNRNIQGEIAPILLTSSLEQVESVFVVENRITTNFVQELRKLCPAPLHILQINDDSSDIWMQDTAEFGVSSYPYGSGGVQKSVLFGGLRAKHDMGLNCAPLDTRTRDYVAENIKAATIVGVGEALPKRRWIDWYGNLEVTPPIKGYPHGRVLTGKQKELTIHPELLKFLEHQTYQMPPLILDVSWLTIGHVDEIIAFVPAPDSLGYRILMPSTSVAIEILEAEATAGRGETKLFAGRKSELSVAQMLKDTVYLEENRRIEESLKATRSQVVAELGVDHDAIIQIPCLFRSGLASVPNMVNSLIVGQNVFLPNPEFEPFRRSVATALSRLGLKLHFMGIYDSYHVRGGEIHCGTNAIRRLKNPEWWK